MLFSLGNAGGGKQAANGLVPAEKRSARRRSLPEISLGVAARVNGYAVCGTGFGTIATRTK
jgi:hypothetical protein